MSEAAMEEAGIHTRTAYIALTGDDENNIMNCLMAKKWEQRIPLHKLPERILCR